MNRNNADKRKFKQISPQPGGSLLAFSVGRNEPCRCGSGKKAKKCCGANTMYKSTKGKPKPTIEEKIDKIVEEVVKEEIKDKVE